MTPTCEKIVLFAPESAEAGDCSAVPARPTTVIQTGPSLFFVEHNIDVNFSSAAKARRALEMFADIVGKTPTIVVS